MGQERFAANTHYDYESDKWVTKLSTDEDSLQHFLRTAHYPKCYGNKVCLEINSVIGECCLPEDASDKRWKPATIANFNALHDRVMTTAFIQDFNAKLLFDVPKLDFDSTEVVTYKNEIGNTVTAMLNKDCKGTKKNVECTAGVRRITSSSESKIYTSTAWGLNQNGFQLEIDASGYRIAVHRSGQLRFEMFFTSDGAETKRNVISKSEEPKYAWITPDLFLKGGFISTLQSQVLNTWSINLDEEN